MKSELLVIADQHAAVNAFPGLESSAPEVAGPTARGEVPKVWRVRGVKS